MGRVKRKGARRLITIGKGGIFFDGPKPLIARRSQRDLSAGPCDQKINLAPSRRVVWRRRSDLSSIYLIRMGLRLVQMLGKKLQADDVMQRMPRSGLFFHLLFANSVQMGSDTRSPHFHRRRRTVCVRLGGWERGQQSRWAHMGRRWQKVSALISWALEVTTHG